VAFLSAINTVAWGLCIREVGDPKPSIEFLIRLVFNKWFIPTMASEFTASILSYIVLHRMDVLTGIFFLSIQMIAMILTAYLVLRERLPLRKRVGVLMIFTGVVLIGK
jgi:drug/metabolite transporter (DMT)-like permease